MILRQAALLRGIPDLEQAHLVAARRLDDGGVREAGEHPERVDLAIAQGGCALVVADELRANFVPKPQAFEEALSRCRGARARGADGDLLACELRDLGDARALEDEQMCRCTIKEGDSTRIAILDGVVGQLPLHAEIEVTGIDDAEVGIARVHATQVLDRSGRGHVGDIHAFDVARQQGRDPVGEELEGAAVGSAREGQALHPGVGDRRAGKDDRRDRGGGETGQAGQLEPLLIDHSRFLMVSRQAVAAAQAETMSAGNLTPLR